MLFLYSADVSAIFHFSCVSVTGKGGGVRREKGGGHFLFGSGEGGGRFSEEGRRGGAHRGWECVFGRGGG